MTVKALIEKPDDVQQAVANAPSSGLERLEMAAEMLAVEDDNGLRRADELLASWAQAEKLLEEYWAPKISAAHALHKMLLDAARPFRTRLTKVRSLVESKVKPFLLKCEHEKRQTEIAVAQAAEAERKRVELESLKLAARGLVKESQAAMAVAQTIVAPVLPNPIPELDNVSTRMVWTATVTDKVAFLKAVAEADTPLAKDLLRNAVEISESYLKKVARANDGLTFPGVDAKQEHGIRVAAAR